MEKRISARAIIIENDKIYLMFRRKNGRSFYAFPGGKKEDNETLEECVKRELFEELGINIEPKKLLYEFISKTSHQYFYLCDYTGGIFGTGQGEEYDKNPKTNYYEPRIEYVKKLNELELYPTEIKHQLIKDINSNSLSSISQTIQLREKH